MQKLFTWLFLLSLIFVHTCDMELTEYYVGNNPNNEVFPPMRWAIGTFGIYPALWISRVMMYAYFWLALVNQEKKGWFYFLFLITVLYFAAMLNWMFQLGLWSWPFPSHLRVF